MKKCEPLVSIIVPCYNVEKYLGRCINSILNQTYNNIEILLVDDGSTDNSGKIADELAKKDQRIKVIHKLNEGLGFARNSAINIVTGDFITTIDSDDIVSNNYIEKFLSLINKYNSDIAVSQFITFKEIIPFVREDYYKEGALSPYEAVKTMFYQAKFDTSAWAKLYKTSLFNGVRYSHTAISEDLETTYKLMLKSKKIAYTMEPTYFYYLRNDSMTGCQFNKKKLDVIKVSTSVERDVTNNHPKLIPAMECRLLSAYFNIFFQVKPDDKKNANILWKHIKLYRKHVLMNIHARKKARIGAAISYLGKTFTRFIFSNMYK
jgi:glycosyltransferase involved in cell wall biosynthesis